jgi:hypothetical protein
MKKQAEFIFRRVKGRIVPIYKKHQTAIDLGAAGAAAVGAMVGAEKARNKTAEKLYYKGRKGFSFQPANFVWDAGVSAGLFYGAYKGIGPVRRGAKTAINLAKKYRGFY